MVPGEETSNKVLLTGTQERLLTCRRRKGRTVFLLQALLSENVLTWSAYLLSYFLDAGHGFWAQGYRREHEVIPTLMELMFSWGIETINKREVTCNSKR